MLRLLEEAVPSILTDESCTFNKICHLSFALFLTLFFTEFEDVNYFFCDVKIGVEVVPK